MVEAQGNSVRLYLEGLMIFAFDEEQNRFEAGILNVDDGHNLKVRTYSRESPNPGDCSDESWIKMGDETIPDTDLRRYEQGKITILGPGGKPKNISSPLVPRNSELWMPFNLIPDIEDILESKVKLIRSKVKPVLSITGGHFFSVLKPAHLENRRTEDCGFTRTYRLEKDQVMKGKKNACGKIGSLEGLTEFRVAVKELAIRAYTAATIITLNEGEELNCVLKGKQTESKILFKIKYAPDREAKVAIENAVTQHSHNSGEHSHHGADNDPMRFFHFLHFYDAIKNSEEIKTFFLANEEKIMEFMKDGVGIQTFTGATDPFCPAVRIPGGLIP
jgi:hypothetical protein